MLSNLPPEHMDRWSRNERLYRQLLGFGLVAVPIFVDEDRTKIDHLWVSVEPGSDVEHDYTAAAPGSDSTLGHVLGVSAVSAEANNARALDTSRSHVALEKKPKASLGHLRVVGVSDGSAEGVAAQVDGENSREEP